MSKLQEVSRRRNGYKFRIKGMSATCRALHTDTEALTLDEQERLHHIEELIEAMLACWNNRWGQLRNPLRFDNQRPILDQLEELSPLAVQQVKKEAGRG